jgi:hypothetical protein
MEPLGENEIAALLGVKPNTVHVWRVRGQDQFPEPEGYIGRTPWWSRALIIAWAKRTERWTPEE